MDGQTFDRLTKAMAVGISRRRLGKLLVGGYLGAIAELAPRADPSVLASHEDCPVCTTPDGSGGCSPVPEGTICTPFGNPCITGTCTAAGFCAAPFTAISYGTPCHRALDPCFVGTCQPSGSLGFCGALTPVAAGTPCRTYGTPCRAGQCASNGACASPFTLEPTGTPCRIRGTSGVYDLCVWGACQADGLCGSPITPVCAATDECHGAGICNPNTGSCSSDSELPNGTVCETGNRCTADTCQGGVCTEGPTTVTCTSSDPCRISKCNPGTGECDVSDAPNGTPCDDDDACTAADRCHAGSCTGGTRVACPAPDPCRLPGVCNAVTGDCDYAHAPDGTPCDDGDRCTRTDVCQAGSCVGQDPVACTAPDPCHGVGACDPATGLCSAPPLDVETCQSGRVQDGPCLCDGACCATGGVCAGNPGERRCRLVGGPSSADMPVDEAPGMDPEASAQPDVDTAMWPVPSVGTAAGKNRDHERGKDKDNKGKGRKKRRRKNRSKGHKRGRRGKARRHN